MPGTRIGRGLGSQEKGVEETSMVLMVVPGGLLEVDEEDEGDWPGGGGEYCQDDPGDGGWGRWRVLARWPRRRWRILA